MRKRLRLIFLCCLAVSTALLPMVGAQTRSPSVPLTTPDQSGSGLVLDFTAGVYRRISKQPLGGLGVKDFRVIEDGNAQTIVNVTRETSPLSIVAVVALGEGRYCEGSVFNASVTKTMARLAQAFAESLKPGDELAIIATDQNAQMVRGFDARRDTISTDFAEVARISDASQRRINAFRVTYHGVPVNYTDMAFHKAATYLRQHKRQANRPVILFLRDFYNNYSEKRPGYNDSQTPEDVIQERTNLVLQEHLLISWLGDSGQRWNPPSDYFRKLPDLTGGERESCYGVFLRVKDSTDPLARVLEQLRTRYRITYLSTNSQRDGRVRKLKLEVAAQWLKGKDSLEVRAPQAIIAARDGANH